MKTEESFHNRNDSRKSPRYKIREDILLFNQSTFAEIINISEDGIAYRYLAIKGDFEHPMTSIDLLNNCKRIHVRDIPCEALYFKDESLAADRTSTVRRTCGLKFAPMDEGKKKQLKEFIRNFQLGLAEKDEK